MVVWTDLFRMLHVGVDVMSDVRLEVTWLCGPTYSERYMSVLMWCQVGR